MTENPVDTSAPPARRSGSKRPASADQERLVRRYLSAVEMARPGRGVKRAADAIGNRITKVDELLVSADPLQRVHLIQERIELHAEYVRITNGNHAEATQLERDFVRVVRSYGDRNGITYAAWRQVGVDAAVLDQAGIHKAEKKAPPAAVRAAEQAKTEQARTDQATTDQARIDQATTDQATTDQATTDQVKPGTPSGPPPGPSVAPADTHASNGSSRSEANLEASSPGEVSLDELADLLSKTGPEPAAPVGGHPGGDQLIRDRTDQPRLGEEFPLAPSAGESTRPERPTRPSDAQQ